MGRLLTEEGKGMEWRRLKATKEASEWLAMMSRQMSKDAYLRLLKEARKIAKEQRATKLGRGHCRLALKRLSQKR